MGPEFHETRMGHTFYEAHVPQIARSLERLAKAMEGKSAHTTALENLLKSHMALRALYQPDQTELPVEIEARTTIAAAKGQA